VSERCVFGSDQRGQVPATTTDIWMLLVNEAAERALDVVLGSGSRKAERGERSRT
jgi:hypothetical protein